MVCQLHYPERYPNLPPIAAFLPACAVIRQLAAAIATAHAQAQ